LWGFNFAHFHIAELFENCVPGTADKKKRKFPISGIRDPDPKNRREFPIFGNRDGTIPAVYGVHLAVYKPFIYSLKNRDPVDIYNHGVVFGNIGLLYYLFLVFNFFRVGSCY